MNRTEDKSGRTRSFSLARATEFVKSRMKAAKPHAQQAGDLRVPGLGIVCLVAKPVPFCKIKRAGRKTRLRILISRINSSIDEPPLEMVV
jgi:hypothetical protein